MGVGAQITMRVFVEPADTEVTLETLTKDRVRKVEIEAFLEQAIQRFLIFHFHPRLAPDVEVQIE